MKEILIGIDIGTTNTKVVAIDTEGQEVAKAAQPTPVDPSTTDAASPLYDAYALWETCASLIKQVTAQLKSTDKVAALAISSMGEAGVLIDKDGRPLFPVLTWHDKRTLPYKELWQKQISSVELYQLTGLPFDHIYSVNKICWYRDQQPHVFSQARTWLSLADWVGFCLTGNCATSYSQACRTMLFDIKNHSWSSRLLSMANISPDLMPPAHPSGYLLGKVLSIAAQLCGLPCGVPVAIGGHDHICAAFAVGAFREGVVLDSVGTSEAIMFALNQPISTAEAANAGLCCGCHTVGEKYYLVGGVRSGAVMSWLGKTFANDSSSQTISLLIEEALSSPFLANGVWFLPYLDGSGPPDRDPDAWGAWLGLRLKNQRADLIRAALEGIGFSARYLLEGLQKVAAAPVSLMRSVGGGTQNLLWQELKASIIGKPIEIPQITDVSAQGAALIAAVGIGIYPNPESAVEQTYRIKQYYQPSQVLFSVYDDAYQSVFLRLYPLLRTIPIQQ